MISLPSHGKLTGRKPILAFMDLETFCTTDLRSHGAFRYAEDAEVMLWAYALQTGDVKLWDVTANPKMPADLSELLYNPDVLTIWHNGMSFDRTVIRHALGIEIPAERVWDTMAQAYAHSLPGSLDTLGEVMGLPQDMRKLKTGRALIQLFCCPRPKNSVLRRATSKTHPAEWVEFCEYAKQDINAMRELFKLMPRGNMNADELRVFRLDAKINARGVRIDTELCEAAIRATDIEQARLKKETRRISSEASFAEDSMESATQRDKVLGFILAEYGVKLEDLTKSTVSKMLDDPDVSEGLKELLAVRRGATTTSTSKYKKFLQWTCKDGRLRGALQYCGALRTGRWAGRGPQLQNLPRPQWGGRPMDEDAIENGLLDDMADYLKQDALDMIAPDIIEGCSALVRGVIIPSPGKKLVVADLAGIEARVTAYLAGEEWILKAFREYDAGTGPDQYKLTYSKMFNCSVADVNKSQRQIGKVAALFMSYSGGVGAFLTGAANYKINLDKMAEAALPTLPQRIKDEAEGMYEWALEKNAKNKSFDSTYGLSMETFMACDGLKRLWREANPKTVALWRQSEDAFRNALINPGTDFAIEDPMFPDVKRPRLVVRRDGNWTKIVLPSKRSIYYPMAEVAQDGTLSYLGVNQISKKWCRIKTYSGKLVENMSQSFSRDVMAHGMLLAEGAGYEIALTVHDEIISEAPDNSSFSAKGLADLMSVVPKWATGLPLSAAGFEAYRYRK